MAQITQRLDMTTTETFRHLQRLEEVGLIQRKPSGSYGLTPLGRLSLSLLSGFAFASKNAGYFADHEVSYLPSEFVERIGELIHGVPSPSVLTTMNYLDKICAESKKYIWTISDQVLDSSVKITIERLKAGVTLRLILPESYVPRLPVPEVEGNIERKYLPEVHAGIAVTEKDAVVTFPSTIGKLDYSGFTGHDPTFVNWARDYFLHQWERARPRTPKSPT